METNRVTSTGGGWHMTRGVRGLAWCTNEIKEFRFLGIWSLELGGAPLAGYLLRNMKTEKEEGVPNTCFYFILLLLLRFRITRKS